MQRASPNSTEEQARGRSEANATGIINITNTPDSETVNIQDSPIENTEQETTMSALEQSIQKLLGIDGSTGAAIVDVSSGMALATGGSPGFDLEVAAAGNCNVVNAKLQTIEDIGLSGHIEDIMITLDSQYHLINVLDSSAASGLFVYLVLDRKKANLALGRHKLKQIASSVSV